MLFRYPSAGSKPILFVLVEDMATGTRTLFPMLLDTGADENGRKMYMSRIEIDPRICGGKPVIHGTRIPVAVLVAQLADRQTGEKIMRGYPELSEEDIRAPFSMPRRLWNTLNSQKPSRDEACADSAETRKTLYRLSLFELAE